MTDKTAELQWRRNWKVDLRATPWKLLNINNTVYLTKAVFKISSYAFMLTDMKNVWIETVDEAGITQRIGELNPSIEAPISKITDHLRSCFESPIQSDLFTFIQEEPNTNIELQVTSKLTDVLFNWRIYANLASAETFLDHLAIPSLMMVAELMRRQQVLFSLLKSKDREIDDYKSQGAKTSRKQLETAHFDEIAFCNNMDTSQEMEDVVLNQGTDAFSARTNYLYTTLMTKYAWFTHKSIAAGESEAVDSFDDSPLQQLPTYSDARSFQSWGNRIPPSLTLLSQANNSPTKSPAKSPAKAVSSSVNVSPPEDVEIKRRDALMKKLAEKDTKMAATAKMKKRKIPF